jgi:3-hydroxyisobutyrate dehydrogenase-like beta-hydroxyacid dehydrogenase
LAAEAAGALQIALPGTALVGQLVNALLASGGADLDYSAVGTVLFELAGIGRAGGGLESA